MKIGPQAHRTTAVSASNEETIVVRGRVLSSELMGRIGFTEHFWLLLTGELPSSLQCRLLDATLVAIAEHGLVPSVVAARMTLAAAPEALQGAVAAGILGCGSVILGSAEAAGRFLAEIVRRGGLNEPAATALIAEYRAERRPIPGYGHPLHKGRDPRTQRLLAIAAEAGSAGRHVEAAQAVERLLPSLIGKTLPLNVSGAIPAVLLDAGFPLRALKGIPILARTASLIAHLTEEQQCPIGFALADAGAAAISYSGAAPEGFRPSEG